MSFPLTMYIDNSPKQPKQGAKAIGRRNSPVPRNQSPRKQPARRSLNRPMIMEVTALWTWIIPPSNLPWILLQTKRVLCPFEIGIKMFTKSIKWYVNWLDSGIP